MPHLSDKQAQLMQSTVNSIGDAVIACDLEGHLIFYNSAAIKILGPDVSEGSPKNWTGNFGVFCPDTITPFPIDRYPLLLGLKGESTNGVEQFIRNKAMPEGVFISLTGRPILDQNKKILGSVVIMRDISSQKKAEEEIRTKNIELVAVNKELESFSYSVSHDLRAPLRSIIGFSDILLKQFSDSLSTEGLDYLTRIKVSGDKLGQLIDGLLDLSRLTRGSLKRQKIDLSEISKSIASELQTQYPERIVHFEITEGVIVDADQRLLRSVMQNLIGNAWKFTSKKPEAQIKFGTMISANGETAYYIKDNGAGFNEKYSAKLFNIYQRLHSQREFDGNGIGLATVQRVIQRHGGTIWAEGKANEGATFYFTL